ncbi:MAG: zinc ribbon domain-containing protein [Deltaproteobacteria bacterium]|nr:zinc ribbon domain-containing protein [Deltaproteobacteria bacterium]
MEIVIILIISAAVAIYIALPFFLKSVSQGNESTILSQVESGDPVTEKLQSLDNHKEALFSAIRDIDFDYGLGKLSKEDFEELNNKYKLEAAAVLKEMDKIQNQRETQGPDYELEKEILSHRKSRAENLFDDKTIEEEISAFTSASYKPNLQNVCFKCGSEYLSGDSFCSKCGASLN